MRSLALACHRGHHDDFGVSRFDGRYHRSGLLSRENLENPDGIFHGLVVVF